jgi:DNA helicase HerA-like ATPase
MHSFVSLSFTDILAEARKYKLSLFLAHQYIEQIHEKIRYAIFGNVGTMIIFRVGADDAKQLVQEVYPTFNEEDLINLPRYSMYLKLMIDGATSKPFSATTNPITSPTYSYKTAIIGHSGKRYGKAKEEVEQEINNRSKEIKKIIINTQDSLFEKYITQSHKL